MEFEVNPVKFLCCLTNLFVLDDPVAGQRATLTAHTGSRHHQVRHIAPLYDHTGDARACTPSSGGQIESGFHASSVRTVSEPSPTSLPPLLTRPMLHHRRKSHRPTLCRPRWRHPHSHLRLASPTRAHDFISYILLPRHTILHFRRAASGCCASVTPTGAARCKVIMCIPPMLDRRARLSTSPPCAETRPDQIIYLLFIPLPLTRHCVRL